MQAPYMEGVAHHHGPESAVPPSDGRYAVSLTAGRNASWDIELRNHRSRTAGPVARWAGETRDTGMREVSGETAESQTPCERGNLMCENRESLECARRRDAGRPGKARGV